MSLTLPIIDLSTAVVGSKGAISLASSGNSANVVTLARPAHLQIFNESGCGLLLSWGTNSGSFTLPAGGWTIVDITPGEQALAYTVIYKLPSAPVSQLICDYYDPYEQVGNVTLGNSPVGIGGAVNMSNTSIKNDGAAPGTSLIESTPSDQVASAWSFNNDGSGILEVLSANVQRIILKVTRGDALVTPAIVQIGDVGAPQITTFNGILSQLTSDGGLISSSGSGGLTLQSLTLAVGGLGRISVVTGSGNGTFNHNLGAIPDIVIPIATAGTTAIPAAGSYTSTQFTLNGTGYTSWHALCLKLTL